MSDAQEVDPVASEVEAFLTRFASRVSATRFGVLALNDPTFVRELRTGRECRRATRRRVREFMLRWREQHEAGDVREHGSRASQEAA